MSYSSADLFRQRLLSLQKYVASFFKREWQLEDYPVRTRRQDVEAYTGPERWKPVPWVADICRWHISGSGPTEESAIENLRNNLSQAVEVRLREGLPIPRPGTTVPIGFASQDRIDKIAPSLYEDFIKIRKYAFYANG